MSEEVGIVILIVFLLVCVLAYFCGYHEGHKDSIEKLKCEYAQQAAKPVPKIGDVTEYKVDTVKCRNYYPMQLIESLSQDELDIMIKDDLVKGLSKSLNPYISYYATKDFEQDMYMVHGMIKVLSKKKGDKA